MYKCPVSTACSVRGMTWAHQSYSDSSSNFSTKPLQPRINWNLTSQINTNLSYSFLKLERCTNALFQLLVLLEAWHELINHIPTLPLISPTLSLKNEWSSYLFSLFHFSTLGNTQRDKMSGVRTVQIWCAILSIRDMVEQMIWLWNHTSYTKVYFNAFVSNALRDNILITWA